MVQVRKRSAHLAAQSRLSAAARRDSLEDSEEFDSDDSADDRDDDSNEDEDYDPQAAVAGLGDEESSSESDADDSGDAEEGSDTAATADNRTTDLADNDSVISDSSDSSEIQIENKDFASNHLLAYVNYSYSRSELHLQARPNLWHCLRFASTIRSLRVGQTKSASTLQKSAWRRLFDEAFGENRPPAPVLSSQDLADYLPRVHRGVLDNEDNSTEDHSIAYSICRFGEPEGEVKRLPILGADANAGLAFAGGRIRCLAWLPPMPCLGRDQAQLLLVCPDWPEAQLSDAEKARRRRNGTVQIWRVGADGAEISIAACLCHEFGPIVACAWLPSPPPVDAKSAAQHHYIALACSGDGLIRIARLPAASQLILVSPTDNPIAEPLGPCLNLGLASVLVSSSAESGNDCSGEQQQQQLAKYGWPTCLEVRYDSPQPVLVLAGFSSGLCAAWHLDCVQFHHRSVGDVQGLRYSAKSAYLNASRVWLANPIRAPVLAMRLEPECGDTLAVSCADRRVRLYSLSQLAGAHPAQLLRLPLHSLARDLAWCSHGVLLCASELCGAPSEASSAGASALTGHPVTAGHSASLDDSVQSGWRLAHSPLRDGLATARLSGQVRVSQLPVSMLFQSRRGLRHSPMLSLQQATPSRPWLAANLIGCESAVALASCPDCPTCCHSAVRCYACVRATHRLRLTLPPSTSMMAALASDAKKKLAPLNETELAQLYPMHLAQCLDWSRNPAGSDWLAVGLNCGLVRLARVDCLTEAPSYGPLADVYFSLADDFEARLADAVSQAAADIEVAPVKLIGRPRKKAKEAKKLAQTTARRRGRPPKNKSKASLNAADTATAPAAATKSSSSPSKVQSKPSSISQSLLAIAKSAPPLPNVKVLFGSSTPAPRDRESTIESEDSTRSTISKATPPVTKTKALKRATPESMMTKTSSVSSTASVSASLSLNTSASSAVNAGSATNAKVSIVAVTLSSSASESTPKASGSSVSVSVASPAVSADGISSPVGSKTAVQIFPVSPAALQNTKYKYQVVTALPPKLSQSSTNCVAASPSITSKSTNSSTASSASTIFKSVNSSVATSSSTVPKSLAPAVAASPSTIAKSSAPVVAASPSTSANSSLPKVEATPTPLFVAVSPAQLVKASPSSLKQQQQQQPQQTSIVPSQPGTKVNVQAPGAAGGLKRKLSGGGDEFEKSAKLAKPAPAPAVARSGVFKYSAEQLAQMMERIRQFEQDPESIFEDGGAVAQRVGDRARGGRGGLGRGRGGRGRGRGGRGRGRVGRGRGCGELD